MTSRLSKQLAEAMSMERSDDFLGDGWKWSTRHVKACEHQDMKMKIDGNKLMFDVKKTNKAAMSISGWDETDWPFVKMVMITHFPEAQENLTETFMSD